MCETKVRFRTMATMPVQSLSGPKHATTLCSQAKSNGLPVLLADDQADHHPMRQKSAAPSHDPTTHVSQLSMTLPRHRRKASSIRPDSERNTRSVPATEVPNQVQLSGTQSTIYDPSLWLRPLFHSGSWALAQRLQLSRCSMFSSQRIPLHEDLRH